MNQITSETGKTIEVHLLIIILGNFNPIINEQSTFNTF